MSERAVSTTVSYVLALAVATILVGGLIVAGSTFVEERREAVVEQELRVVGEHLAGNIEQVDRYARAPQTVEAARITQTYPSRVTGSGYVVTLRGDVSQPQLQLNASNPDVRVTVNVTVQEDVATESVANGGRIVAVYDTGAGELEIQND